MQSRVPINCTANPQLCHMPKVFYMEVTDIGKNNVIAMMLGLKNPRMPNILNIHKPEYIIFLYIYLESHTKNLDILPILWNSSAWLSWPRFYNFNGTFSSWKAAFVPIARFITVTLNACASIISIPQDTVWTLKRLAGLPCPLWNILGHISKTHFV